MKKLRLAAAAAAAVFLSFTLSGCMGREPNEIAYIVALGIDILDENNYEITIQYANPTEISGGEEGGKAGSAIIENISVEAPNIYAAVGLANKIVSKTFSLSHARIIVVSKEVAQKGLRDITETFIRSDDLRPDIYLAVSADGANKYLSSVKPAMEVNPAKYYQLVYDKNTFMGIPIGSAKDFFFGIETGDYDSFLPIAGVIGNGDEKENGEEKTTSGGSDSDSEGGMSGAGVSEEGSGAAGENSASSEEASTDENSKQREAPQNENGFEYKMKNYIGGQAAVELKNKSESMGLAVFSGDKIIGEIGSIDAQMFKLLMGDYNYSYITLYNEQTPEEPVTVKVIQEKNPDYDINIKNKTVNVKLTMEGDVSSLPYDYNLENDIARFEANSEKYISEDCRNFMTGFINRYDSDIFRLKERCKKKFLTDVAYDEFKKNVDFREYDINVDVDFSIRRTGLVVREGK